MNAILISTPVNMYYLTGHVFAGYVYLPEVGETLYFAQRDCGFEHPNLIPIRKPEEIPSKLAERGLPIPTQLALEIDALSYNEIRRIMKVFDMDEPDNATLLLRRRRMVKSSEEIDLMRQSATKHMEVYRQIPNLYKDGMRDIDLQIEIEHLMRQSGSIGIFRSFGSNMEIFMGSLLAGANAETASPFDFALGGAGINPSLPIGASGEMIRPGITVCVDMAGNYTPYISDMTRIFSLGELPEIAVRAHEVSVNMNRWFREECGPGTPCKDVYNRTVEWARSEGLADYFMGTRQQAKFVGHGVGLEINEPPVLMSRSTDFLEPGMIIAYEPKFVIPEVGAVGIENTYLITEESIENLTPFEEEIMGLSPEK